jgi:hypothetical protein
LLQRQTQALTHEVQNSAMNIAVQQRVFAFSSEYEIETPACIYSAKKKSFFLRDQIRLFAPRSRLLATIRGHFSFRPKYDVNLADGQVYHFWCERFWKGVFVSENSEESFRLYEHKQLNDSIFQKRFSDSRISKNRVKIGRIDRYEIRRNDDAKPVVIVRMALVMDGGELQDDSGGTGTIDLGSRGPEERPFLPFLGAELARHACPSELKVRPR